MSFLILIWVSQIYSLCIYDTVIIVCIFFGGGAPPARIMLHGGRYDVLLNFVH